MKEVHVKYKSLQKEWKAKETVWSVIHYSLGIAATVLAALASRKMGVAPTAESLAQTSDFAVISAILAAILTFLSPSARRKAYTEACDRLRITRMRYETQDDFTERDLNDAVQLAQDVISKR